MVLVLTPNLGKPLPAALALTPIENPHHSGHDPASMHPPPPKKNRISATFPYHIHFIGLFVLCFIIVIIMTILVENDYLFHGREFMTLSKNINEAPNKLIICF